jgi:hypothetical protein
MENRPVLETLARLIETTLKDIVGENRHRPKRMLRDYFSPFIKRLSKLTNDQYDDTLILDELNLLETALKEAFVILQKRKDISSNEEIINALWEDYNKKAPLNSGQALFFKYLDIFKKKLPEEKSYYTRIFNHLAEVQKLLKQIRSKIKIVIAQSKEAVPVE